MRTHGRREANHVQPTRRPCSAVQRVKSPVRPTPPTLPSFAKAPCLILLPPANALTPSTSPFLPQEFSRLDPVLRLIGGGDGPNGPNANGGVVANGGLVSNGALANGSLSPPREQTEREAESSEVGRGGKAGTAPPAAGEEAAAAATLPPPLPLPPRPPPGLPAPEVLGDEGEGSNGSLGSGGKHDEKSAESVGGNSEAQGEEWEENGDEVQEKTETGKEKEKQAGLALRHPCAACGLPASKRCNACVKVKEAPPPQGCWHVSQVSAYLI